jgi:hypothetical protein
VRFADTDRRDRLPQPSSNYPLAEILAFSRLAGDGHIVARRLEGLVRKSIGLVLGAVVTACPGATGVLAEDDFPIAGTYAENVVCKGDGSDANVPRVKISVTEIDSSVFGLCTILERKREGVTFSIHVECKGPGGAVMLGDVKFTVKDDKTLDFADQDNTYKAVLHKCPQ